MSSWEQSGLGVFGTRHWLAGGQHIARTPRRVFQTVRGVQLDAGIHEAHNVNLEDFGRRSPDLYFLTVEYCESVTEFQQELQDLPKLSEWYRFCSSGVDMGSKPSFRSILLSISNS